MRSAAVFTTLIFLASCGPTVVEPADTPEHSGPPSEQMSFDGDFNAIGTEPFWALDIRQDELVWNRMDEETERLAAEGPLMSNDSALWTADGLSVTLTEAACSDGMSDRIYAYQAVVVLAGETLRGCATRPDADLGPAP